MTRWARRIAIGLLLAGAAGCATTGSDPRDPHESFNRKMFAFNEAFDENIGKPIATTYRDVVPGPIRTWVRNFYANIGDLWIGANNLIQGKPADAVTDWARFAFNTTIGLLGINDVATSMGLEKHDEDFGQTMGRWGLDDGAYLVWPFLGSSDTRDTVGLVPDLFVGDPVAHHKPHGVRGFMVVTRAMSKRADLLDASRILEEAALDKYVFQRDAYLQRRRSLIYDGNPPREPRLIGSESQPRAELAEPQAGEPQAAAPAAVPQHAAPEAVEAGVRLLEAPVSLAASAGG